jgi:hypothetical protein
MMRGIALSGAVFGRCFVRETFDHGNGRASQTGRRRLTFAFPTLSYGGSGKLFH